MPPRPGFPCTILYVIETIKCPSVNTGSETYYFKWTERKVLLLYHAEGVCICCELSECACVPSISVWRSEIVYLVVHYSCLYQSACLWRSTPVCISVWMAVWFWLDTILRDNTTAHSQIHTSTSISYNCITKTTQQKHKYNTRWKKIKWYGMVWYARH